MFRNLKAKSVAMMEDDFRALRGYTLKEEITYLYGVNPVRVLLSASLNNDRRSGRLVEAAKGP